MRAQVRQSPEARPIVRVTAAAVLVAALVWGVVGTQEAHAVAALTVTWLFFAGGVTGALALSAVLELCGADWALPLQAVVLPLSRYLPIAAALLVVLAAVVPEVRGLHGAAAVLFFAREVASTFALFAFGRFTLRGAPGRGRPAWMLVVYCLLFAGVGSLWAFDFVVVPSPGLGNTVAGPHLFTGAFVSGLAFTTIGALRAGMLDRNQLRDTAMLVIALAILWAYLFWSQLLTFTYTNLPEEVAFLSQRSHGDWAVVSAVVVFATLVVPFALLLGERGKHSARLVFVAAASQLVGIWLERELLIAPSMVSEWTLRGDLLGALMQFGMASVFVVYTWPWVERTNATTSLVAPPAVGAEA